MIWLLRWPSFCRGDCCPNPPSPLSLFNHNSVTFGANPGLVQFLYDIHEGLSYPFLDVSQLFKFFAIHLSGYGNRLNA